MKNGENNEVTKTLRMGGMGRPALPLLLGFFVVKALQPAPTQSSQIQPTQATPRRYVLGPPLPTIASLCQLPPIPSLWQKPNQNHSSRLGNGEKNFFREAERRPQGRASGRERVQPNQTEKHHHPVA